MSKVRATQPLLLVLTAAAVLALPWGCSRKQHGGRSEASAKRALRVALESELYTFDPHRLNETTTLSVLENIFETLVAQDANLKLVPGLASGWETPDDLTWRVHLRRGVLFHGGQEMTSRDVEYSYRRVLAWPESGFRNNLSCVSGMQIVDEYTVDIKLKRPYGVVANLGCIAIIPANYVEDHGADGFNENPIGTGPYRLKEWRRGQSIRLSAFDDYWRGRAAFDEVVFMPINPPIRRVEMLEHLELDIAWMIPLRREPPVHYRAFFQPALHVFYLAFDCRSEKSPYVEAPTNPFRDPRVRQAFMYGIDTSALIDEVFSGHAYEASQLVSPSIFGYDPDLKRPAPDRGRARELLAAAGYPGGFSVRLDLQPTRRAVGEFLRREYEKIGIRIELNLVPKEQFYDKIYTRRDSSLYFLGWACSSGDASELFEYALHTEDPVNLLGVRNVSGYSSIEVDRLIEKSLSTFDSKERLRMLQDAMGIVMTDMPLLPLYIGEDIYGVSNTITFMPRLDDHILGYDARPNE